MPLIGQYIWAKILFSKDLNKGETVPSPPPVEQEEGDVDQDETVEQDQGEDGQMNYITVPQESLETVLDVLILIIIMLLIWNIICTVYCCYTHWRKRKRKNYQMMEIIEADIDIDKDL